LWDGFLELRIRDDDVAGIDVSGVDAALLEGGGDDVAGDSLAVADDEVGDARGELEDSGQTAQDLVKRIELSVYVGNEGSGIGGLFDQGAGGVAMARAEARADGQRTGAIALCGARGGTQQLVSDLGHGGNHDDRLFSHGNASSNDFRGTPNGNRILDRCAAKLHDYQAHANLPNISQAADAASAFRRALRQRQPVRVCRGLRAVRR
jgi:hypothetical protein